MRRFVATLAIVNMLAACGGTAATPSAPPTAAPTPTLAPSPTDTLPAASPPATAGPSGSGAFVLAGLASTLDPNGGPPNTSTFTTSFASDVPTIYVPYQLGPGLAGKVTSTWKASGSADVVGSFDYPAGAPWAYFSLTHQGGFIPGTDQEILTFEPTGASVTLTFTVTGPQGSAATPTPLPSGSAFSLLRMATAADRSKTQPDPATYTDSFPTTAAAVYVIFVLRSGLSGTVTLTMTRGGSSVVQPLSLDVTVPNGWNDFHVDSSSGFPVGDYVVTVTFTPTGEAQTVTFTVK